ncbi:MAG: hypothetical protein HYV03_01190 [Deltaproteobacteria bacterium]|nr:hypothetical protein [Deltaproteobacteria bacterium]
MPLCGVLFFDWSAIALLMSYWLENVVIGFFHVLTMRRATTNYPVDAHNRLVPGPLRPVKPAERAFAIGFFCVHYGIFLAVHFAFLVFLADFLKESHPLSPLVLASAIPFCITHARAYRRSAATDAVDRIPLGKLLFAPYPRLAILHVTLALGAIPIIAAAALSRKLTVLLIALYIVLEVWIEARASRLWRQMENEMAQPTNRG